jgi:hypothetical protein
MSCPYTSPQNGKAERIIRSINNVVRTLLFQASIPPTFWAAALGTATYLLNILPTKTLPSGTPHFALLGNHPSYEHLRVFGCKCYPNLTPTAPTNYLLVQASASSLGIPPITKDTSVLIVSLTASSSLAMWSSRRPLFPFMRIPLHPQAQTLIFWMTYLTRFQFRSSCHLSSLQVPPADRPVAPVHQVFRLLGLLLQPALLLNLLGAHRRPAHLPVSLPAAPHQPLLLGRAPLTVLHHARLLLDAPHHQPLDSNPLSTQGLLVASSARSTLDGRSTPQHQLHRHLVPAFQILRPRLHHRYPLVRYPYHRSQISMA